MKETTIEKRLKSAVKDLGGLALKFLPNYFVGAPDRLILMPGGKTYWVELKSTGEKLRPVQRARKKQLEKLGFRCYKIDGQSDLDIFIKDVKAL